MDQLGATRWICDTCGQEIARVGDGYLEWITTSEPRRRASGFHIVHHYGASPRRAHGRDGCYYNPYNVREEFGGTISDMPLTEMVSADGLMRVLSLTAYNEIAVPELAEIAKRLFIPNYDMVKDHMQDAIYEGIVSQNLPDGFYWQEQIDRVLARLEE